MENLYTNTNTTTTASYSPSLPPPESDDISLFLHQILIHSSSSYSLMAHNGGIPLHSTSPSNTLPENPNPPIQSSLFSGSGGISATESSSAFNSFSGAALSSSGVYFPATATNVSCFSGGITDYDPDDCDWESEEGFEALVEEKSVPPRISLKRGRAAEFHNLSEKRRRSRINEKMKALQNLIPNSNKTDKASMLDEAIEYLKQLQIQVQLLTMRNGLSLYPMCLPEVVQQTQFSQMKMNFCEGNELLNMNPTGILPMNQELTTNDLFNIPNQRTNQAHHLVNALSSVIDSGTSFARESSLRGHLRPSVLPTLSEEFSREDMLPQKLDVDHSEMKSLEAVRPESMLLSALECDLTCTPHSNATGAGKKSK